MEFTKQQFEDYTDEILALSQYLNCDPEEITAEARGDIYTIGSDQYLVCDDTTADIYWEEDLDNYIDECILPELNERYRMYFDDEKFKRDAKFDGRGHSLGRYDGNENEETINGTTYYIYRQN